MKTLAVLLCTVWLMTGCTKATPVMTTAPAETEVPATVPAGTEMEYPLSQEMAMLEGYVVMQDGDVRHNAGSWFGFLEKSRAGEPCTVTIVQFASGSEYVRYDISFDGNVYAASFDKDGKMTTEASQVLVMENGLCQDTEEPYDSYEAYLLNDIVLYKDLIAQPDFEGVTEVFLHAKEGEPPVKTYTDAESVGPILQLLMTSEYVAAEPEDYVYGMKLLMTNRDGKELVIELDLNKGNYRYGMQTYTYGSVSDLLVVLGLEQWPESVLDEFSAFMK